jgi:hypothetical protein
MEDLGVSESGGDEKPTPSHSSARRLLYSTSAARLRLVITGAGLSRGVIPNDSDTLVLLLHYSSERIRCQNDTLLVSSVLDCGRSLFYFHHC